MFKLDRSLDIYKVIDNLSFASVKPWYGVSGWVRC